LKSQLGSIPRVSRRKASSREFTRPALHRFESVLVRASGDPPLLGSRQLSLMAHL
jgi:hypothetical protein